MDDLRELAQLPKPNVPLVREVRGPQRNRGAGVVIDENAAVPVQDRPARSLEPDRSELVAPGHPQVLVARKDLESPEPQEKCAEDEQHQPAENRHPQSRLRREPKRDVDAGEQHP